MAIGEKGERYIYPQPLMVTAPKGSGEIEPAASWSGKTEPVALGSGEMEPTALESGEAF